MKTAAKVLAIIALVFGLIWSVLGFFGSGLGAALSAMADSPDSVQSSTITMVKMVGGFFVTIIVSVLAITACDKDRKRKATQVLGFLTIVGSFALVNLASGIAGLMFLIAGILISIAGFAREKAAAVA